MACGQWVLRDRAATFQCCGISLELGTCYMNFATDHDVKLSRGMYHHHLEMRICFARLSPATVKHHMLQ